MTDPIHTSNTMADGRRSNVSSRPSSGGEGGKEKSDIDSSKKAAVVSLDDGQDVEMADDGGGGGEKRIVDGMSGRAENLNRALSDAQLSMIALGGAVGTGLIIASGTALAQGGPAGLLIGYLVMGAVCWVVLTALAEITSYIPLAGYTGLAGRFIDPAAGVALGYSYLFKYLVITPNQVNASALLISYWRPDLPGSIFIAVFIVVIVASNLCGVRWFGIVEFWLSFSKILILIALILGGLIVSLGGNPQNDRIGFRYWTDGGAFREYKADGALGRFLGTWSTLSSALFAFIGSELLGVCAGETTNPRKAIPRAIRMVIVRILFFYIGGVIVIGMLVSADDPRLVQSGRAGKTASASPFVLAFRDVGINALPSIINAGLLTFTLSASNSDLYVATRTLYGLARDGHVPFSRVFMRTNAIGVPYVCLAVASLFLALAFLNATAGGSQTFGYLTSTVTVFGGISWFGILLSQIRFYHGCKAQAIDRSTLPYKAPLQPYASYVALFVVTLVVLFNGFNVFWPTFDYRSFITKYIGIPVTAIIYVGYKVAFRTKIYKASEMDLIEGAKRYDVLDAQNAHEYDVTVTQAWKEEDKWYKKPLALRHLQI